MSDTWKYATVLASRDGQGKLVELATFASFESESPILATGRALGMVAEGIKEVAHLVDNPAALAFNFTIQREDAGGDPDGDWIVEGSIRQGELLGKDVATPVGTMELIATLVDANAKSAYAAHEQLIEYADERRMEAVATMMRLATAIESQQEKFAKAGISLGTDEVDAAMSDAMAEIRAAKLHFGERLNLLPPVQLVHETP